MTESKLEAAVEAALVKVVKERGPTDFIPLSSAVARTCHVPLQKVEWAIRVLLQQRILEQDKDFRIIHGSHDVSPKRATA